MFTLFCQGCEVVGVAAVHFIWTSAWATDAVVLLKVSLQQGNVGNIIKTALKQFQRLLYCFIIKTVSEL